MFLIFYMLSEMFIGFSDKLTCMKAWRKCFILRDDVSLQLLAKLRHALGLFMLFCQLPILDALPSLQIFIAKLLLK